MPTEPRRGFPLVDTGANKLGYFMRMPVDGNAFPQSNDVYGDDNGIIFLVERFNSFDILEWQG